MECTNNYSCRSLLFLLLLISASISQSRQSINEDEERINSEGMWQNRTAMMEPTEASKGEGNSRFDVGGILTAAGLKTGGSLFGLVVFPLVFPFMLLMSFVLFIISMFGGVSPLIPTGRTFDNDNLGSLGRVLEFLGMEECGETGCVISDKVGHKTEILRYGVLSSGAKAINIDEIPNRLIFPWIPFQT